MVNKDNTLDTLHLRKHVILCVQLNININGSGNQAVPLASNKASSSVVSSRKSVSDLVLAVVVVVLLFIYFVHTDTNDLNLTIDKQQDKSTTDENLIEQIPHFTYTINHTTLKPLGTINSEAKEKM